MFNGVIQERGTVEEIRRDDVMSRLTVSLDSAPVVGTSDRGAVRELIRGESIAVNGVCLTVVEWRDGPFGDGISSGESTGGSRRLVTFDLATETLRRTSFGLLAPGARLNIERSLRFGDAVDGHFVQGHVDAIVEVLERVEEGAGTTRFALDLPERLAWGIVPKGAIALDGVSLTVGEVLKDRFTVYIIPHTLHHTTFSSLGPGSMVNLEIDCLARYVRSAVLPYAS